MGVLCVRTFTFFLLDGPDSAPSFTVEDFAAPEDALEFAHDLLALTTYNGVEVRRGEEEIGVVRR